MNHGVRVIMRRWWISTKLHGRSLLHYIKYLKPVGSTVTKNTVVNTDGCIPLLRKECIQAILSLPVNIRDGSEKSWEKMLPSDEKQVDFFGINSTHCGWRK